jgi:hypothetical protein
MVVNAYNPSTWKAEAGRLRIPGHPELHCETLSQELKKENK